MEITKDIVVIYHGMCRDGFTAAWAAWKKFGDRAEYIPVIWTNQSEQVPVIQGKEVYFLDYCPIQEKLDQIVKDNRSVHVIDHHISREKETKSLPDSVYDINHSGGVLAWKYFHPDKVIPQICLYTEDSDIWKWTIPGSANVLNAFELKAKKFDFDIWEKLAADLEDDAMRKRYEETGALVSETRQGIIDRIIADHATRVDFEGYEVYAINAPRYFRSEIGNILAEQKPPFAIVWNYTPEEISISLRSVQGFDLIPLVSKYGGGGHKAAANFRLPLGAVLPWKIVNNKSDESND